MVVGGRRWWTGGVSTLQLLQRGSSRGGCITRRDMRRTGRLRRKTGARFKRGPLNSRPAFGHLSRLSHQGLRCIQLIGRRKPRMMLQVKRLRRRFPLRDPMQGLTSRLVHGTRVGGGWDRRGGSSGADIVDSLAYLRFGRFIIQQRLDRRSFGSGRRRRRQRRRS